jgi:hypothetical protein
MTLHPHEQDVFRAYDALRNSGPCGRELAEELTRRKTRVWVTPKIFGGFTLNFINMIFIQPLSPGASESDFKAWVSLLGHEACHVKQKFWVDSVEQEIVAYTTQVQVGDELGIRLDGLREAFSNLNPKSPEHQRLAKTALVELFPGQPAAIVYASLPLMQPTGIRAFLPALVELAAVVRAGLKRPASGAS